MHPTYVFSSAYGRVLTVVTAVAAVLAVLAVAGDLPLRDVLTTVLSGALVTLVVWAAFGRPAVEVSDGEVVLVNVTRTVRVPWPLLDHAEARWSLEVHTVDGRRWTAWAAPRSGAAGSLRVARDQGGEVRAGALLGRGLAHRGGAIRRRSTAEAVQAAIDERQAGLVQAGHLDGARVRAADAGLRVTVSWHIATIAAALALAGAVVASRVV